ncbi:MAG TPA: RdgB/HAM1 family non-canonical purine NTP pyrophosphatase [Anaerolineales bacterium]|nr:RdgB/HAM1 family non-canonical purine NTP pyrophosphatase [Anaerolineales bacterium]
MHRLLVATANPGKMLELRALLGDIRVNLVEPGDLDIALQVVEDGATYAENAIKKARAFSEASGLPSLADDTGLEVQALDGAPGLFSRRYLPSEDASDADRRAFLLQNLKPKPRPWSACFRAAVAVAVPGGDTHWVEGVCNGEIIPEERGMGGFGYDRIFLVAGTGMTMAELDLATKNRVSHRGQAILHAMPYLRELFEAPAASL